MFEDWIHNTDIGFQYNILYLLLYFLQRLEKCVVAKEELETDLYSKVRNSLCIWRGSVGISIFRHI